MAIHLRLMIFCGYSGFFHWNELWSVKWIRLQKNLVKETTGEVKQIVTTVKILNVWTLNKLL